MSTRIAIQDGVLTIESLDVDDDIVVAYIRQLDERNQVAGIINCLQLGARALTFAGDQTGAALLADTLRTSAEATRSLLDRVSKTAEISVQASNESLQKHVSEVLAALSKELGRTLDPTNTASIIGKLRIALIDDYRKVTSKVREDLDLSNNLSPLSALRTELEKSDERRFQALSRQLAELLQAQAAKVAASSERSKSTRKGTDFEKATEEFLTAESRPRKDLVRHTGTEPGFDNNHIGDFVVEVNPSERRGIRIVIEDKNGIKTTTGLIRELDKAMTNRGAAFGISVVTDPDAIGHAITPYGDDKLIVRVPPLAEGDGWDFTALSIALDCARWKALMSTSMEGVLDTNRVKADISHAFAILNRFVEAKKKITAGKTYLDAIAEYLDEMKRELTTVLERVRQAVEEATPQEPEAA